MKNGARYIWRDSRSLTTLDGCLCTETTLWQSGFTISWVTASTCVRYICLCFWLNCTGLLLVDPLLNKTCLRSRSSMVTVMDNCMPVTWQTSTKTYCLTTVCPQATTQVKSWLETFREKFCRCLSCIKRRPFRNLHTPQWWTVLPLTMKLTSSMKNNSTIMMLRRLDRFVNAWFL